MFYLAARCGAVQHSRVKVTGLAQKLGQLEAAGGDLQSKYWAGLKLLGQPCGFYAVATGGCGAVSRYAAKG